MKIQFQPAEIEFLMISEDDVIRTSKATKPEATTTAPATSPVDTADDLPWDPMN